MSVHEFVIAPRPNVGPKLDTVGPCQTRAWLSNTSIPALRTTFKVAQAVSLVVAEAARKPVESHRFTVVPSAFLAMKFLSIVLHQARDAVERIIPGDALELVGA